MEGAFCKKYRCEINDSIESSDTLSFNITVPGNKYSDDLSLHNSATNLVFRFSNSTNRLISASAFFRTDYAINRLRPEYAELANDFYLIMTGRKMMQEHEYSHGGVITTCLSSLGKSQRSGKSITYQVLLKGVLPDRTPYISTCHQLLNKGIKQVNRWMVIRIH
ncbi:Hypothetical protein Deide_19262 [Deinococcus deserti VCD115]|uniref:Uncharacterized protein n=1 Tax=Deinococcus deserti (strain DSM 17065 / CIP 109153 / LMG 22923 / VCD115) TaxID=546414 RepID=C1CXW7_DEIDV|nr:Hypothetical protein Deide_19262 [Deinococcus deserti VCD115]